MGSDDKKEPGQTSEGRSFPDGWPDDDVAWDHHERSNAAVTWAHDARAKIFRPAGQGKLMLPNAEEVIVDSEKCLAALLEIALQYLPGPAPEPDLDDPPAHLGWDSGYQAELEPGEQDVDALEQRHFIVLRHLQGIRDAVGTTLDEDAEMTLARSLTAIQGVIERSWFSQGRIRVASQGSHDRSLLYRRVARVMAGALVHPKRHGLLRQAILLAVAVLHEMRPAHVTEPGTDKLFDNVSRAVHSADLGASDGAKAEGVAPPLQTASSRRPKGEPRRSAQPTRRGRPSPKSPGRRSTRTRSRSPRKAGKR